MQQKVSLGKLELMRAGRSLVSWRSLESQILLNICQSLETETTVGAKNETAARNNAVNKSTHELFKSTVAKCECLHLNYVVIVYDGTHSSPYQWECRPPLWSNERPWNDGEKMLLFGPFEWWLKVHAWSSGACNFLSSKSKRGCKGFNNCSHSAFLCDVVWIPLGKRQNMPNMAMWPKGFSHIVSEPWSFHDTL